MYALGYFTGDVDELALISSFNFNKPNQLEPFPRYLQPYMQTEYRHGHAINGLQVHVVLSTAIYM